VRDRRLLSQSEDELRRADTEPDDSWSFLLPEFVSMSHHFSAIDSERIAKPETEDELKETARYIERVYRSTLAEAGNASG
jgi:hypothetical protein